MEALASVNVTRAGEVSTVGGSTEERIRGVFVTRVRLFARESSERTERARMVLKRLLPLLPRDVRQTFIEEDRRQGLYIDRDGSTWRFWTGDDGGGWCLSAYEEEGMALLFAPDQRVVAILRSAWQMTPVSGPTAP
jgi:hypothetical protein